MSSLAEEREDDHSYVSIGFFLGLFYEYLQALRGFVCSLSFCLQTTRRREFLSFLLC